MARLTHHLKILYLTEDAVDKDVPRLEALSGVYNGFNMINLYVSSYEVFRAASALVMHRHLTALSIDLLTYECSL
jgi:hypothetical protein